MSQCDPTRFLLKVKKREKRDVLFDAWFGNSVATPRAWTQRGYTINYANNNTAEIMLNPTANDIVSTYTWDTNGARNID